MISTQAWRNRWRATSTRKPVALCRIDLPGGQTIHAATDRLRTPDNQLWESLLLGGSISKAGSFLQSRPTQTVARFALADVRMSWMADGERLSTQLSTVKFKNAPVTIWLWEKEITDFADALQRFEGIVQTYVQRPGKVDFVATQALPTKTIQLSRATRLDDPQAPEKAINSVLPTLLGKLGGPPARPPTSAPYGDLYRIHELVAGGSRVHKALLVDTGRGGGSGNPKAKVLVAGHKVKQLGSISPNYGTALYLEGPDGLLHVMDPDSADIINTDSEAGYTIPDNSALAWLPIWPVDVEAPGASADNPRAVLDRDNDTTFARLDYTAVKRFLYVNMPSTVIAPGKPYEARAYIRYRTSPGASGLLFFSRNTKTLLWGSVTLNASTTPTFKNINLTSVPGSFAWDGVGLPDAPWDFSQIRLEVDFTGSSPGGTCDVIELGIALRYTPAQQPIDMDRIVHQGRRRRRKRLISYPWGYNAGPWSGIAVPWDHPKTPAPTVEYVVRTSELVGKFFGNTWGHPDTGSGTYTGTNDALIERAPDMLRFILQILAGYASGDIETGSGVFGSFIDARALLKTWNAKDMVFATAIEEEASVVDVLAELAEASVAQLVLSEFTGKWELHPWIPAPAVTYSIPIHPRDLLDPDSIIEVQPTPRASVMSGVRLAYGYDAYKSSYAHEVAVGAKMSSAGHLFRNMRDALMRVETNKGDRLDWYDSGGGAQVFNLTVGEYTRTTFLEMLRADPFGTSPETAKAFGFCDLVVTDVNDKLPFNDGASKTATLTAGQMSCESRATDVAARMNDVSSGWTCLYSRITRKYTISRASGTAELRFYDSVLKSACAILGFAQANYTGGLVYESGSQVEERLFAIAWADQFNLPWRTGTHGLLGTKRSAWELLGFDWIEDGIGIGLSGYLGHHHLGICPKTDLEGLLKTSDADEGEKRLTSDETRFINDTETALESRNRLILLGGVERGHIKLASQVHADLREGDVFEVSNVLDAIQPYGIEGSGGSWGGRRFRVIETHQGIGPSFETEIVAVDVTS